MGVPIFYAEEGDLSTLCLLFGRESVGGNVTRQLLWPGVIGLFCQELFSLSKAVLK